MAGASAVFILDSKGKTLIFRNYRGDVSIATAERFLAKRVLDEDEAAMRPIVYENGLSFAYIKHNNLFLVMAAKKNANAAVMTLSLYKMVQVFKEYFNELEEESVRDNFVIIYELLDEMFDFGYPQATEPKILQEYITQEVHAMEKNEVKLPMALTNAVSWRRENIHYRKNEVFLDVVESVNLLVASNGTPLRSEVLGALKMRCFLSGVPELKLGLNDKVLFENSGKSEAAKARAVELEDVKFHQCVRLNRFESDRTISFIPPDGEFELMSYRLNTKVKPLIWVEAVVEPHSRSRIEYLVKAKAQFKPRSTANDVQIIIPVPPDADSPAFRASLGNVYYKPEKDCIVWVIKQFQGGKEYLMRAHFGLPSLGGDYKAALKTPISVKFEIPYFTVSGLSVRYLKIIEKSGYQALPWVRYIASSGEYELRMS